MTLEVYARLVKFMRGTTAPTVYDASHQLHPVHHGLAWWISGSRGSRDLQSVRLKLEADNFHQSVHWEQLGTLWWTNIAIENGHRNSGFSHKKWWFSIAMLVHQRVMKLEEVHRFATGGSGSLPEKRNRGLEFKFKDEVQKPGHTLWLFVT